MSQAGDEHEPEDRIPSIPRERHPVPSVALEASPRTIRVSISRSPSRDRPRARNARFLQLQPDQLIHLNSLAIELNALTQGSARFASFGANLITDSAQMLTIYGISPIEAFRQMDKQARTYLFGDLRQREHKTYPRSAI